MLVPLMASSIMFLFRPDGPHPGHSLVAEGYTRNADSPISEDPDYADESENGGDTEHNNERGNNKIVNQVFMQNVLAYQFSLT